MRADALFSSITDLQGDLPWGTFLDAGSGRHSLDFVTSLRTLRWTAVTADPARVADLEARFPSRRSVDRIVGGNWTDPALLVGEAYDTVLVDYLVGALDGFSPYFQDRLFGRLFPLCKRRMYVVGLEPYGPSRDEGGELVLEIARLRDACILLAGDRCYREYPRAWVVQELVDTGFQIISERAWPIRYGESFVRGQLDVCRQKLPKVDGVLRGALAARIENLGTRAMGYLRRVGPIQFGEDYVIAAERGLGPPNSG
jgi:hypothetical protein